MFCRYWNYSHVGHIEVFTLVFIVSGLLPVKFDPGCYTPAIIGEGSEDVNMISDMGLLAWFVNHVCRILTATLTRTLIVTQDTFFFDACLGSFAAAHFVGNWISYCYILFIIRCRLGCYESHVGTRSKLCRRCWSRNGRFALSHQCHGYRKGLCLFLSFCSKFSRY